MVSQIISLGMNVAGLTFQKNCIHFFDRSNQIVVSREIILVLKTVKKPQDPPLTYQLTVSVL